MMAIQSEESIERRSRLYAGIGTTTLAALLFSFLLLFYMPSILLPETEGILVSFGDSFDGGGIGGDFYGGRSGGEGDANEYATPQGRVLQQEAASTPQQTSRPGQSRATAEVLTQDEASEAFVSQPKKTQKSVEEQRLIDAERKAKQAEQQRLSAAKERAAQEAERQRLLQQAEEQRRAEAARKRQEAIERADRLGSALAGGNNPSAGSGTGFGEGRGSGNASGDGTGNGSGTGGGVGDGSENSRQGNPVGKGSPTGNWSLTGRELIGSLVPPIYSRNVEGKITVSIRVAPNGTVTNASISSPTTISDAETRNAALLAARKTRFSSGSGISVGSITYNFQLR